MTVSRCTICFAILLIVGSSGACQRMKPGDIARTDIGFLTSVADRRADCIIAGVTSGSSTVSPPFDARCGSAPDKKCRISASPSKPWEYQSQADDPAWKEWIEIGYEYELRGSSWFHRQVAWELDGNVCRVTGTLFGDFDDDGDYSTYERVYAFTPVAPGDPPSYDALGEPILYRSVVSSREDEDE